MLLLLLLVLVIVELNVIVKVVCISIKTLAYCISLYVLFSKWRIRSRSVESEIKKKMAVSV